MSILDNMILYPQKLLIKRKNFNNMKLYFGSAWFTITPNCMVYILKYLENNPEFQKHFRTASCPMNIFFN